MSLAPRQYYENIALRYLTKLNYFRLLFIFWHTREISENDSVSGEKSPFLILQGRATFRKP